MVYEKLKELICEQLKVSEDLVTKETSISDDLGADSLDMVDLVMSIEEAFDVVIEDADIESIKTIGDLCTYIEKNQN